MTFDIMNAIQLMQRETKKGKKEEERCVKTEMQRHKERERDKAKERQRQYRAWDWEGDKNIKIELKKERQVWQWLLERLLLGQSWWSLS